MYRIRKVGIGSAFKVSAVITTGLWMVFGFLAVILASASPESFVDSPNSFRNPQPTFDAGSFFMVYLCSTPLYGVIGGLVGALYAFIYNLASGWVGGIEIEMEEIYSPHFNPVAGYQPGVQPYYPYPQQPQPPTTGYQPYSPPKQKNDWTPIRFDDDKPNEP